MKTTLLALLTSVIILPTSTNLTASYKNVARQEKANKIIIQGINKNQQNNNKNNSGYDWDSVQNSINNVLKDQKITSHFTTDQISKAQASTQEQTSQFNASNANANDAIANLKLQSPQFKEAYDNNQSAFEKLHDKINAQFFGVQKVDLNLDASNTYADAINNLNIKINSTYPGNNIVVSLADTSLAKQYLFDDKTIASLSDFIDNKISIKVNIQFGNNKPESKIINLTNIKIDPTNEDPWLYESITSYFNELNPQDLNLTASDNRYDAFNNIINKIQKRFNLKIGQDINDTSGIQMALVNNPPAKDNFMQKENIYDVMNQDFYFDINIADYNSPIPKITKQHLYLRNINFNLDNMETVFNKLWLHTKSKNNPIDLELTSDQKYQDVINNFDQRMENLNQKNHFQIRLTDPSLANQKLDEKYDPRKPDFKANVSFGFLKNGQFQTLGTKNLYLSNVKLSKADQKIKAKFDQLTIVKKDINFAARIVGGAALFAGVLALGVSFLDPEESGFLGVASAVLSTMALGLTVAAIIINKNISMMDGINDVLSAANVIIGGLIILFQGSIATLSTDAKFSILVSTSLYAVIGTAITLLDNLKDYSEPF